MPESNLTRYRSCLPYQACDIPEWLRHWQVLCGMLPELPLWDLPYMDSDNSLNNHILHGQLVH